MLAGPPPMRPVEAAGAIVTQPTILQDLSARLEGHGLRLRGGFPLVLEMDQPAMALAPAARSLLLVGNAGSEMWRRSGPAIEAVGLPNPLDRWTRQVIDPIAADFAGIALFPFDGPPFWPFQRWAARAEGVAASPLGILMHPVFGLWHAYRAAILLPVAVEFPTPAPRSHPCDTCADRPCLATCPVDAFTASGYDVERCVRDVAASKSDPAACFQRGCLARLACPVGPEWRYEPEHAEFHMRAFVVARLGVLPES